MSRIHKSTEVESRLVVASSWGKKRMGVRDDSEFLCPVVKIFWNYIVVMTGHSENVLKTIYL